MTKVSRETQHHVSLSYDGGKEGGLSVIAPSWPIQDSSGSVTILPVSQLALIYKRTANDTELWSVFSATVTALTDAQSYSGEPIKKPLAVYLKGEALKDFSLLPEWLGTTVRENAPAGALKLV